MEIVALYSCYKEQTFDIAFPTQEKEEHKAATASSIHLQESC